MGYSRAGSITFRTHTHASSPPTLACAHSSFLRALLSGATLRMALNRALSSKMLPSLEANGAINCEHKTTAWILDTLHFTITSPSTRLPVFPSLPPIQPTFFLQTALHARRGMERVLKAALSAHCQRCATAPTCPAAATAELWDRLRLPLRIMDTTACLLDASMRARWKAFSKGATRLRLAYATTAAVTLTAALIFFR